MGGRPEGGHRQAARELNIPEQTVRRAYQTASLSPEAQEAAVETGLDDNRSALLEAAKERTPEAQTATIRRLAEPNASTAEPAAPAPSAKPLRDLVGISGGEFAPGSKSRRRTIDRTSSAFCGWLPTFSKMN